MYIDSAPFKHLIPLTDNARKFEKQYGGLFSVKGIGNPSSGPAIQFKNCKDENVIVRKRSDGIYVNNKFFCKQWEDIDKT